MSIFGRDGYDFAKMPTVIFAVKIIIIITLFALIIML